MNLPVEGAFHNLVLVSIKKQYPFHAARLAHGLWGSGQMSFSKVICVVDDDVDVQDVGQVAWRLLANLDPKRDLAVRRRPDRPARPRRQPGALGQQGVHRRHAQVEGGGVRARVARAVPHEPEAAARVDAMWAELGIDFRAFKLSTSTELRRGSRVASPRRRARSPGEGTVVTAPIADLQARRGEEAAHGTAARRMFDRIAPTYDTLNRLLSAGIDRRWRVAGHRRAGRGARRACRRPLRRDHGPDGARRARHALAIASSPSTSPRPCSRQGGPRRRAPRAVVADANALPFGDGAFAAVVCGFGVRNLADPRRGAPEVLRVLRPGGVFVVLELFRPRRLRHARLPSRPTHTCSCRRSAASSRATAAPTGTSPAAWRGFLSRERYEQTLAERRVRGGAWRRPDPGRRVHRPRRGASDEAEDRRRDHGGERRSVRAPARHGPAGSATTSSSASACRRRPPEVWALECGGDLREADRRARLGRARLQGPVRQR